MSNTIRNLPHDNGMFMRMPKGKRNALRNNVRYKAVPRDVWDDININNCDLPYKIAAKMLKQNRPYDDVIKSLKRKFNLSHKMAEEIIDVASLFYRG